MSEDTKTAVRPEERTETERRSAWIDRFNATYGPSRIYDWDTVEGDDGQGWITLQPGALPSAPLNLVADDAED